uniref:Caspase-8 n=1 Tax=Mola mola TaxID=94237 RepID=A0A3Q3VIQ3_MOLML
MDFQKLLLEAGKALSGDEVKALAFLCTDLLSQTLASVKTAGDLFSRLADRDHLSVERPHLLSELLFIIKRNRLARDLNLAAPTINLVSLYRKLLYSLSEELTDGDLKSMKFLLNKELPRRKLDENITTLEVFLEMEHMDLINETNLDLLESIIQPVCPVLTEKILQFKADQLSTGTSSSVSLGENNPSSMMFWTNTNTGLTPYPMTAVKRGVCLIINNYDFTLSENSLQKREGTMIDGDYLHRVFQWLGFEIETQKDCTIEKMLSVMQELSGRNHSQMDCLVCCILSHGAEGRVYGVDGRTVTIRELMDPFSGTKCSSLVDKPKLFFIQACQGNREQERVFIEADGPTHGLVCRDDFVAKDSIPSDADFLLGMATVSSFVSYRDKINGTWFIQSLCLNLVQMVPRDFDLVSILTKVNADVSQKTDSTGLKKQMPQPAFTLTKKVVFPIPRAPPPVL